MAKERQARKLSCFGCDADLTATKQEVTRDMGMRQSGKVIGERTFTALKAPFRIEVVITTPKVDDGSQIVIPAKTQSFWFCESCKDIPQDALAFIRMQKNERNPNEKAPRASRDLGVLKL